MVACVNSVCMDRRGAALVRAVCRVLPLMLLAAAPLRAADIRYHGLTLNDQYRLQLEEVDGTVTFVLLKKDRAAGGPALFPASADAETPAIIRKDTLERLARLRVEVLRPAAPNYVRNPGERFRITIDGMDAVPNFTRDFEADAADALAAVYTNMHALFSMTYGVRREALYTGTLVALRVLNEAQRLPAELPLTTLRSGVGKIRIQGPGLGRARQPTSRETLEDAGAAPAPPAYHVQRYAPPQYPQPRKALIKQLDPLGGSEAERRRTGQPLTEYRGSLSPVARADRETIRMLRGTTKPAMELRAERAGSPRRRAR